MKIIILPYLAILLLFVQVVSADGGGWSYSYATDKFSPLSQSQQICSIDYKDGTESMLISIRTKLEGDKAVWIFPVPSNPEKTEIDIVKEFPEYSGYDVKSKAGYDINKATPIMVISQVWLSPLIIMFWQLGIFAAPTAGVGKGTAGGEEIGIGEDSGIKIHEHIEKMGLATELVTSENERDLDNYLRDKGLNLPEESVSVIKEYIGKEYSFVISWVSDVEEYKKEVKGDILAVKIKFPTKKIYYPLRLTSIYGEKRIPITVYVNGYVSPDFYENIKGTSKVRYYANDKGLKYTKININTRSGSFTEDLWIDNKALFEILIADFIATNSILSMIILFALYSCLASIISGLIIFRREVPVEKLAILGLTNFLTVIGFAIAVRSYIEKSKKKGAYIVLFSILFLVITISTNWIFVAAFPLEIHRGGGGGIAMVFEKIRPLNPGELQVDDANYDLDGVFINAAGAAITITDIDLDYSVPNIAECTGFDAAGGLTLIGGTIVGLDSDGVPATVFVVSPGDTFSVLLACYELETEAPGVNTRYSTQLTFDYTISIGGIAQTRTETGRIDGTIVR